MRFIVDIAERLEGKHAGRSELEAKRVQSEFCL
jgi:hypothetical protein